MIPLFNTDGTSTCPLGFPMNQNRMAVPVWSYAMEVYPPARIIELGSYNGGFTTAIGVHAWRIKAKVYSFDRMQTPDEQWLSLATFLGISFYVGDLFASEFDLLIQKLIRSEGVSYLLCDNGDKVKEFSWFAKFLKPGDVIAAHDYRTRWWPWTEIKVRDVAEIIEGRQLKPWMQEHFDLAGWLAYKKA